MAEVWGYHPGTRSRAVDKALHRLRAKVEPDPSAPVWLHALRGQGVRFTAPSPPTAPVAAVGSDHLLGRDAAKASVREWWAGEGRLLTLFGGGGIGKTSLARWFSGEVGGEGQLLATVDARGIDSPADLEQAVAGALGLREAQPGSVVASLREHGRVLLILDDPDAVAQVAAPKVEAWLGATTIRLLATSRVRLRIGAEEVLPLPPLEEADAVALLKRHSRWPEGPVLHELARRLEGLPLALELAAAHGPLTSPKVVLKRLDALLDHPSRPGPEHHRSMAAALDQSWSRLSPSAQAAMGAVASLGGGPVSLEAAEPAVGAPGALLDLVRLVNASLLQWEGELLGMFSTVRHLVLGRIPEADQRAARQRLGAWLADVGTAVVDDCPLYTEADEVLALAALTAIDTVAGACSGDTAGLLAALRSLAALNRDTSAAQSAHLQSALAATDLSVPVRARLQGLCLRVTRRAGDLPLLAALQADIHAVLESGALPPPLASWLWMLLTTCDLSAAAAHSRPCPGVVGRC